MIIGIDPGGRKGSALALLLDGRVSQALIVKHPFRRVKLPPFGPGGTDIVVERVTYQGGRTSDARPQDIITLAWNGAALAYYLACRYYGRVHEVTPNDWKGAQPKPVQHWRMWQELTDAERDVLGGTRTETLIRKAREKGAAKRWRIRGGDCYPRNNTTPDLLDAVGIARSIL